ncbi:hypothetical protein DV515_00006739, partial [Chloebia gouldiae]
MLPLHGDHPLVLTCPTMTSVNFNILQTALPVGLGGDHPFPGPTELPGLAGSSRELGPSSVLTLSSAMQNGGAQLLITTSSEVLAFHPVGQAGLEGLLGKQSLGSFHADIPALPS